MNAQVQGRIHFLSSRGGISRDQDAGGTQGERIRRATKTTTTSSLKHKEDAGAHACMKAPSRSQPSPAGCRCFMLLSDIWRGSRTGRSFGEVYVCKIVSLSTGSIDTKLTEAQSASFTLLAGVRFVFGGKSNKPEGTAEMSISYAPSDPELTAFCGFGVVYVYLDNFRLLMLLRGLFHMPDSAYKPLSWLDQWFCPLRSFGMLAKQNKHELALPPMKLKKSETSCTMQKH